MHTNTDEMNQTDETKYLVTDDESNFALVQNPSVQSKGFIGNDQDWGGYSQTMLGHEVH